MERYDPQRDTWTVVTNLGSPCCLGSLVALRGKLYAVGGYDGACVLQSLQVWVLHVTALGLHVRMVGLISELFTEDFRLAEGMTV